MNDISSRADIELLVNEFYRKVRENEILDHIFDDVVKINWEHHIPILCDFWESLVLDVYKYNRNAMAVHFQVNQKIRLEARHFAIWLALFDSTVDANFHGEKAEMAKKRAHAIGDVILLKLESINQP